MFEGVRKQENIPIEPPQNVPGGGQGMQRTPLQPVAANPQQSQRSDVPGALPPETLDALKRAGLQSIEDEPRPKRFLVLLLIAIVVIILGVAAVLVFANPFRKEAPAGEENANVQQNVNTAVNTNAQGNANSNANANAAVNTNANVNATNGNANTNTAANSNGNTNAGLAVDTDRDGLSDSREAELETNPLVADTDRDELSDFQEVVVWGTDPLDSDTDNDGFSDGGEVKNGYNPLGTGALPA